MLPVEQWIDRAHELGLVGEPTEKALEHSRAFSALVRRYGAERWVDLGSGGGIPGLIVALELPASEGLLVDARQRRAAFLTEAVRALNWSARVRIAAERGEVLARSKEIRERADAVVARGFGAPPVTAEIGSGFVRVGGVIVVSDPPEGAGRRWSASEQLARLGLVVAEVVVGPTLHCAAQGSTARGTVSSTLRDTGASTVVERGAFLDDTAGRARRRMSGRLVGDLCGLPRCASMLALDRRREPPTGLPRGSCADVRVVRAERAASRAVACLLAGARGDGR